jgi:hypothetical protein
MAESSNGRREDDPRDLGPERSVAELVRDLSKQTTRLARQEVELAKAEMAVKGRRLGIGAGAFGGAGLLALFAFGALTAAAVLALAEVAAPWLAALIVAAAYGVVAGILALLGRERVQAGTPPVPEQAIESSKEDVEWARTRAKSARQ